MIFEYYLFIVLAQYNMAVRRVNLSGPTSFAPIIRKAIDLVVGSNNQVRFDINIKMLLELLFSKLVVT